jgi:hypothetical protein
MEAAAGVRRDDAPRFNDVKSLMSFTPDDRSRDASICSLMESNMSGNRNELRAQTQQLLDGPLKHIRGAALAAALLPLASVAATPASAQAGCPSSGGICGIVFNDANHNGIQDDGAGGLANVHVIVKNNNTGVITDLYTDADGRYSYFVTGGTDVTISAVVPTGYEASPFNVGDDTFDSDGFNNGGPSVATIVVNGATGTATDFGFFTQTVPLPCTIPAASEVISPTSWNKFSLPFGKAAVVWVHAQFDPTGVPATTSSTVQFTGVSFVLNGISYPMPDGVVNFDPNAPFTSTTTFSGTGTSSARWTTTINPNFISDENFFVGAAIPVDAAITGGGKATIRFTTQTDDTDLSFSWQWSAAVYTYWPPDWNQAMVQPYHGNGRHADTPNNTQVQKSLIQGPRGGGGSNFTGSWSATGHGACK